MRYLAEPFIIGALRRGRSVEQFLGPVGSSERPGVRYAEVRAARTSYEVYVHAVEDVGHESLLDLEVFPPFDQDSEDEDFGQFLGTTEDPQDALVLAEECTGALRGDGSTRVSCRTSTATSSRPAARPACRRTGIPGLTCAPAHADVIAS
ncbi:hypothetical protein OG379_40560 (plasmid) [Streptomyces sp. NBC_01166]|uniref:hypothetical protein n=1 Tax=Streptomyces sp. NBC_01166 TaxID=2903755 RepID=UPI00386C7CAE|nr:hypothetical protein OG379_40560 [Streptomyces sp. NBC_01166]